MSTRYRPSKNLLDGIRTIFPMELTPWDDYYMRMAQADFLLNRHNLIASKTFFIRKAPFKGSFALLGGLTAFLRVLEDYTFDNADIQIALHDMGYCHAFVKYLINDHRKIDVKIYAPYEGSVFFPSEPTIIIEGSLLDCRLAEGILLKNVNFPTLALTKWARVVQAAAPGSVMEFARRRAQDDIRTSLYAHLAGAELSSNAEIRRGFDIPIRGTMGHEWIQSYGDEFEAFDEWLEVNPDRPVLLVDTINTLKSGVPNAIKAFKIHWDRIKAAGGVAGIRNDSGDLAYITIEERLMLDAAGLYDVVVFETNDLDEYSIQTIREQIGVHAPQAGLDPVEVIKRIVWACGTQPGTCADQPSLGGVAKLSTVEYWKEEREVIKLAFDNPIKTSIPGSNRSTWLRHKDTGEIFDCVIHDRKEDPINMTKVCHPDDESKVVVIQHMADLEYIPRQRVAFENNRISNDFRPTMAEVTKRIQTELAALHWTYKRLDNPHAMKVSLSPDLFALRKKMIWGGLLMNK
jgi:nicotinate phosphoribosyltransferase